MRGVIRSVLVLVLLGLFTVACLPARQVAAELPPDIMAEAERRRAEAEQRQAEKQAERLIAKKDYGAAREALDKIVALQREHYITLSDQFHFHVCTGGFVGRLNLDRNRLGEEVFVGGRDGRQVP